MRKKIDLTNQKFGRLTALEDAGRTKRGNVLWKCQCECGNIVTVRSGNLQSGVTQSCGCYNKERTFERTYKDLTGTQFGRLTVLEDVGRRNSFVLWKCQCECGTITNVVSNNLQKGNTQSCGCLHKEQASKTQLGNKHHNWKGGITPTYLAIRNCLTYKNWRTQVYQRDSYTCQDCEQVGGNLHAHHIIPFSQLVEEYNITTLEDAENCSELWNVSNGTTLCLKCHKKVHHLCHSKA